MNTEIAAKPCNLCAGIKELLAEKFTTDVSGKLFSKSAALKLGGVLARERIDVNFSVLIDALWQRLSTNWVEAGCPWRGSRNWRWEPCLSLDAENHNPAAEVALNRRLANALPKERWANEVPTASGLSEKGGSAPGGLDFAYSPKPGHVQLIELKVGAENPVSAAFQVVIYGLVLTLARLVHERLKSENHVIEISERWRDAQNADLLVVAPTKYYAEFPKLGWFERGLAAGVAEFGSKHGFKMLTFGFRRFDEPPHDEPSFLAALNQPIQWG